MLYFWIAAGSFVSLLLMAGLVHAVVRSGSIGRGLAEAMSRAPLLDLLVAWFTVMPPVVAFFIAPHYGSNGTWWNGLLHALLGSLAAIAGQVIAMQTWVFLHELAHPAARKGPRILKVLNAKMGRFRNHTAVWWTALAVPIFSLTRLAEIAMWPMLVLLVRFPRYNQGEWVNVSRHKFSGLVGHDLIWCLYCDWMTGVWSLGTEMLRNVESFWCPIRFSSTAKCENCKIDFPDIDGGWVRAEGNIADAAAVVDRQYPAPNGDNSWFGHPARLTVRGKAVDTPDSAAP
jgi:hypothetical protein